MRILASPQRGHGFHSYHQNYQAGGYHNTWPDILGEVQNCDAEPYDDTSGKGPILISSSSQRSDYL